MAALPKTREEANLARFLPPSPHEYGILPSPRGYSIPTENNRTNISLSPDHIHNFRIDILLHWNIIQVPRRKHFIQQRNGNINSNNRNMPPSTSPPPPSKGHDRIRSLLLWINQNLWQDIWAVCCKTKEDPLHGKGGGDGNQQVAVSTRSMMENVYTRQ